MLVLFVLHVFSYLNYNLQKHSFLHCVFIKPEVNASKKYKNDVSSCILSPKKRVMFGYSLRRDYKQKVDVFLMGDFYMKVFLLDHTE